MSFAISWFVVIMQLLWRFVDDLVGKGIEATIFIKLMFYAAMTVVPLALVLAVLVASLMTFGNLGERLELLAMKSAGVPLYTIMKPIFISVVLISFGLFVFQNDWMIKSQVKFWTYYFSIRNKSPELAIPQGVFYKDLNGYSIYVKEKDPDTKLLKGLMIYDYNEGFSNATVIVADSGRVYSTKDNSALILEMFNGESFKNLRNQSYAHPTELIPYLREKFDVKEVHISFDANLNMVDEGILSSQFVGKNILELKAYTDSLKFVVDSLEIMAAKEVIQSSYQTHFQQGPHSSSIRSITSEREALEPIAYHPDKPIEISESNTPSNTANESQVASVPSTEEQSHSLSIAVPFPSRYVELPKDIQRSYSIQKRISDMGMKEKGDLYARTGEIIVDRLSQNFFTRTSREDTVNLLRKNLFEYHRKMTYPVACLVFFFIGAPLGAIIRKGGLGTPIVTAVLFFIVYYILESMGLKMAREGKWVVWIGMWMPSMVLAPIGLWLSYIATKDSTKLNLDNYINAIRKVLGTTTTRKLMYKEVAMESPDYTAARGAISALDGKVKQLLSLGRMSYSTFFLNDNTHELRSDIYMTIEGLVENLSNSRDYLMINRLANYPVLRDLTRTMRLKSRLGNIILMALFPIGLLFYVIYAYRNRAYMRELKNVLATNQQIVDLLPLQE